MPTGNRATFEGCADRKLNQVVDLSCCIFVRWGAAGMITMDMIGKIRRLHRRDHLSEREIARKARLSRNTVRKWLHGEVPEPPKNRQT